jgi:predicted alpha/beta-fold hydrolase
MIVQVVPTTGGPFTPAARGLPFFMGKPVLPAVPPAFSAFTSKGLHKNPNFTTVATTLGFSLPSPRVHFIEERMRTPDDDVLVVDWTPSVRTIPASIEEQKQHCFILAAHGLGGHSRARYIQRLFHFATVRLLHGNPETGSAEAVYQSSGQVPVPQNPIFHGVSHCFRDTCKRARNLTLRSYHAAMTEDIHLVACTIAERYPGAAIVLVGYSLGGLQVMNYVARHNAGLAPAKIPDFPALTAHMARPVPEQVIGAMTCSTPLLLGPAHAPGGTARVSRGVDLNNFLAPLRRMAKRKTAEFAATAPLSARHAMSARTISQFDTHWTAPINGWKNATAYYQAASMHFDDFPRVEVPTLIFCSKDDPIAVPSSVPFISGRLPCSQVQVAFSKHGGHIGFVSKTGDKFWLERQTTSWFLNAWHSARNAAADVEASGEDAAVSQEQPIAVEAMLE